MRPVRGVVWSTAIVALGLATIAGCGDSSTERTPVPTSTPTATTVPTVTPTATPIAPQVFVYWDQNEEEDALTPDGHPAQLIPPWDPNGQMCILRDGSGRFVTGYNPTLPSQHNPGSLQPLKNPPVGMALWNRDGTFSGQTIYVPGPYALPGESIGGDIPPDDSGTFNDHGSFTGCAIDSHNNLFAADIGGAQGSNASPDEGRIIEWFAPDYASYCIIIGPTQGGDGAHHVDGTGGLRNPGIMAVDPADNLYIPESGNGRVLRIDHAVLPQSAQDCNADGLLDPPAPFTVFIRGAGIPAGIARDPTCSTDTANCWAVTNILSGSLGGNAVSWFDDVGHATSVRSPIPAGTFSPFGVAVSPTGDVFFVDIALGCSDTGCGTLDAQGGVFKVSFTDGQPGDPQRIADGLNFPTSVTVCDAATQVCPEPSAQQTPAPVPTGSGPG